MKNNINYFELNDVQETENNNNDDTKKMEFESNLQ